MTQNNELAKWHWMMEYCHSKGITPTQAWAWDEAKDAYEVQIKLEQTNKEKA